MFRHHRNIQHHPEIFGSLSRHYSSRESHPEKFFRATLFKSGTHRTGHKHSGTTKRQPSKNQPRFLPARLAGGLQPWSWGGTASLEGVLELCPDPGPEPEVEEPSGRAGKSGRTPRAFPKSLGPRDSTRTFTSR